MKEVLERLRQHKLFVKLKKCEFSVKQVEFLGFIVGTNKISIDPSRVETIKDWPIPKSVNEIQMFLGFANFYRRFIEAYSRVARPLTDLLSKQNAKSPFLLGLARIEAFEELKRRFTTTPMLRHFDLAKSIQLETDALSFVVARVMS